MFLNNQAKSFTQKVLDWTFPEGWSYRNTNLDFARFICVLNIVLFHFFGSYYKEYYRLISWFDCVAALSFYLTFMGSGYFIAGILLNARNRKEGYGKYVLRRTLRIWPTYFFILGLYLIVMKQPDISILGYYLTFTHGFFLQKYPWLETWTLSIEEYFYFIAPLVI